MRLIVTGRHGQIARALVERGTARGIEVIAVGRPQFDLAEPEGIATALVRAKPDVVVNAAAYTEVDDAETNTALADKINRAGAAAVAAAARTAGASIIQLSTDYVFDGRKTDPWREHDATEPLSAYGRSKLAGEQAVADASSNHVILRTAWLYSPFGRNFVKTMLLLARTRPEIAVVSDQVGSPTSALALADAILTVASNLLQRPDDEQLRGIFHLAGEGRASRAEFASAVFEHARALEGPHATVKTITTADYPTHAARPANSVLDCALIAQRHGVRLPPWREALRSCVERILMEQRAEAAKTPGGA